MGKCGKSRCLVSSAYDEDNGRLASVII